MDSKKENKPENPWLNLGFNIILPSFLLIKGGKLFESLGITGENVDAQVFVFALAFPIIYPVRYFSKCSTTRNIFPAVRV